MRVYLHLCANFLFLFFFFPGMKDRIIDWLKRRRNEPVRCINKYTLIQTTDDFVCLSLLPICNWVKRWPYTFIWHCLIFHMGNKVCDPIAVWVSFATQTTCESVSVRHMVSLLLTEAPTTTATHRIKHRSESISLASQTPVTFLRRDIHDYFVNR